MKKVDILIILIVFAFSIILYTFYFSNLSLSDDLLVEITYRNTVVYSTELKEDTDILVEITSADQILSVKVGDAVTHFPIASEAEILNTVHITSDLIEMDEANCKNKYCLLMKLKRSYPQPIVCTNGIMVRLVTNEIIIEV